jgi:hypothetical protein
MRLKIEKVTPAPTAPELARWKVVVGRRFIRIPNPEVVRELAELMARKAGRDDTGDRG